MYLGLGKMPRAVILKMRLSRDLLLLMGDRFLAPITKLLERDLALHRLLILAGIIIVAFALGTVKSYEFFF